MTKPFRPATAGNRSANKRAARGLTLIELMVSLVIGLLLAIIASSTYLYSKQAYNSVSENSQLEENGRMALDLLTRYVQSAGYVAINPKSAFPYGALDLKVTGCDHGMASPQTASVAADLACKPSTATGARRSASITTVSETDQSSSTKGVGTTIGTFQGFNCVGNAATVIPADASTNAVQTYVVRSNFFISSSTASTKFGTTTMGQLSCVADATVPGGALTYQPQPLIPGVVQLAVNYLTPSTLVAGSAQKASSALALTTADTWNTVTGVELCVMTQSIQSSGNDTGIAYKDCYNADITAVPGQTFRLFRTTVKLRNRSGGV